MDSFKSQMLREAGFGEPFIKMLEERDASVADSLSSEKIQAMIERSLRERVRCHELGISDACFDEIEMQRIAYDDLPADQRARLAWYNRVTSEPRPKFSLWERIKRSWHAFVSGSIWETCAPTYYDLFDLGQMAEFLIPTHQLRRIVPYTEPETVETTLHAFLFQDFGIFSTSTVPSTSLWRIGEAQPVGVECRRYEVPFANPGQLRILLLRLHLLAYVMEERDICIKVGNRACLIAPK